MQTIIEVFYRLIYAGSQLFVAYLQVNGFNNFDQLRNQFYEVSTKIRYQLGVAMEMEEVLTHAIEYLPVRYAHGCLPEPAIETETPANLHQWQPEPANLNHIQAMQQIANNIENNQLYQIDWHQNVLLPYSHLNHSVRINEEGVQVVRFPDGREVRVTVERHIENSIRLRSNAFLVHEANLPVYYNIFTVNNRKLIYRCPDNSVTFTPVYSSGIHGGHPILGMNGWQAMVLQLDGTDERVHFVDYQMAGRLRRLFEVWDVMKVYRLWFNELIRFTSMLFEMNRSANQLIGFQEHQQNQLYVLNNWLTNALPQITRNYWALEKLQLLHRHSILIGTLENQPKLMHRWPNREDALHLDDPDDYESDDNTDAAAYWGYNQGYGEADGASGSAGPSGFANSDGAGPSGFASSSSAGPSGTTRSSSASPSGSTSSSSSTGTSSSTSSSSTRISSSTSSSSTSTSSSTTSGNGRCKESVFKKRRPRDDDSDNDRDGGPKKKLTTTITKVDTTAPGYVE